MEFLETERSRLLPFSLTLMLAKLNNVKPVAVDMSSFTMYSSHKEHTKDLERAE